jgi:hypothetical protein
MSTTIQDVFSPGKNATPLNRRKLLSAMLFQGTVLQKVVNRKLGCTTVFTTYDRFTKLPTSDIRHFLVANYRLGRSSRKS